MKNKLIRQICRDTGHVALHGFSRIPPTPGAFDPDLEAATQETTRSPLWREQRNHHRQHRDGNRRAY